MRLFRIYLLVLGKYYFKSRKKFFYRNLFIFYKKNFDFETLKLYQ